MSINLVPEQRTDKNGVLTTRWVKPHDASNSKSVAIPQPSSNNEEPLMVQKEHLINSITERWVNNVFSQYDNLSEKDVVAIHDLLIDYSLPTLEDFNAPSENDYLRFLGLKGMIDNGASTSSLRDFSRVSDLMNMIEDYDDPDNVYKIMKGVSSYSGFHPLSDDEEYPVQREQQCLALLRLISWTDDMVVNDMMDKSKMGTGDDYYVIQNSELVNLLLDKPDDAERIVDFVYEREADDVEAIRSYLENEAPAISDGVL